MDDDALAEAQRVLGTSMKKETGNAALVEVSKQLRRLQALDKLAEMGEVGDFDVLLDKQNYRG